MLNRQTFESRVRDSWSRAISGQHAVTVIMIDGALCTAKRLGRDRSVVVEARTAAVV